MNDAIIAKDALLGKSFIELKRVDKSRAVKLYMRYDKKTARKDKRYLKTLGKYLTNHLGNKPKRCLHIIDAPGETYDYLILEIVCEERVDASSVQDRWEEYKETIF